MSKPLALEPRSHLEPSPLPTTEHGLVSSKEGEAEGEADQSHPWWEDLGKNKPKKGEVPSSTPDAWPVHPSPAPMPVAKTDISKCNRLYTASKRERCIAMSSFGLCRHLYDNHKIQECVHATAATSAAEPAT